MATACPDCNRRRRRASRAEVGTAGFIEGIVADRRHPGAPVAGAVGRNTGRLHSARYLPE